MKSFKKAILAAGLTLAVVASIGGSAFCDSYRHKNDIGGYGATVASDIKGTSGSAYTSYGGYGTVSLNSTYVYCSTKANGDRGTYTSNKGHYKSVSTSFTAPNGSRSVSISTDHYVAGGGEKWYFTTSDIEQN